MLIFTKIRNAEDIKSHHYIISYDPADVTENGLTGERAQAISIGACEADVSRIPGSGGHTYRWT